MYASWKEIPIKIKNLVLSSSNTLIGYDEEKNNYLNSKDFGQSFLEEPLGKSYKIFSITSNGPIVIVIALEMGSFLEIKFSNDAGESYKSINGSNYNLAHIVSSIDGIKLFAKNTDPDPALIGLNGDAVYTSNDSGQSWNKCNLKLVNVKKIAISDDGNNLVILDMINTIYTSKDFGLTWKNQSVGNKVLLSLKLSNDGKTIIVGGGMGHLHISNDFGETWNDHLTDKNRFWFSIDCNVNGSIIAAVAGNDYIYISLNFGKTWYTFDDKKRNWRGIIISKDETKFLAFQNDDFACSFNLLEYLIEELSKKSYYLNTNIPKINSIYKKIYKKNIIN
jgi:hypothetical protein